MNDLLKLSDTQLEDTLCPSPITPYAWTFTGKELKEAIRGERLLNVSIDLSNECNLNCPYCFTASANSAKREKKENYLSFDNYKEIVLQLKDAGTKTINIIGEGEPTMYPYFDQLIEFISLQGIKILLTTNGIILSTNDKRIDLLNEIKATIVLKVNSRNSQLQDTLVGRKGYASLRDRAFNKLIEKHFNTEIPTRLAINTLLIKPIYDEFYDLFLYCRNNNISLIASVYMPTGRTYGVEFHGQKAIRKGLPDLDDLYMPLDQEEMGELLKCMKDYDLKTGITRATYPAYISGIACTQLLGLQIDNQGKVWCCPTRMVLDEKGNLISDSITENTHDIKTLWKNNSFLMKMRKDYNGRCIFKQTHQKY